MGDKIRVAICVPTGGECKSQFCHSVVGLIAYGRALQYRPEAESVSMTFFMNTLSVIHANREYLVDQAMAWDATHVLFLDDDMVFEHKVLPILLGRRYPIVGCNYVKKALPAVFTAVRHDFKGHIITTEESGGLEAAAYVGFGCCLIEAQVFRKMKKPWFMPGYNEEHGTFLTEDHTFFASAWKEGFQAYVDHDASKFVGHIGQYVYDYKQHKPEVVPDEQKLFKVA